ncbi:NAD(P)-dependent oxidoreductase [Amnibacterium flavum]|uniref:NAD-dependent epimerase n=1 Tax=Amnibacterium flavum TaxID=2173173 RepID=A0A2V1HUW2_9MICO|nr:NAD(P)H-binding protein [Amnibacterium flavum]PVZ94740.1 NAD-dependent epimerase [Amnibacterium flavum]
MARITVLGGTGYAGGHIVQEAAARGHQVTSYSRNAPENPVDGVTYETGSVLEHDVLAAAVADTDAVIDALSPRGDMAGKLEGIVNDLVNLLEGTSTRLGVVGGASSLLVSEGGPRLIDTAPPAPEVADEIQTGITVLQLLSDYTGQVDWFYVSPAALFGSWAPGEATGTYRTSDDILLVDDEGISQISGADFAKAIVDEIETPSHHQSRFHVAN